MCIIAVAHQVHRDFPWIYLGNRDEFYTRETEGVRNRGFYFAGKDLEAGGIWAGVRRDGRLIALTNFRKFPNPIKKSRSRGLLVRDLLESTQSIDSDFAQDFTPYMRFNVIGIDGDQFLYTSSEDDRLQSLPPGIHVLSNGFINNDWPKVRRLRQHFTAAINGFN